MAEGKFITFEGVEGSGKTHQLGLLKSELERLGVPHIFTLEPGGTAFGQELREVLLRTGGASREPVSELLLYLADRYQHLNEVIHPALDRGIHVISDRYHDATVVYQGYAREIGLDLVEELASVLQIKTPDLTVVLDLEPEVGLERARARNWSEQTETLGRFEAEELEFHERVRAGYRQLAEREPKRVVLVDADGSPEEVFERILTVVRGLI